MPRKAAQTYRTTGLYNGKIPETRPFFGAKGTTFSPRRNPRCSADGCPEPRTEAPATLLLEGLCQPQYRIDMQTRRRRLPGAFSK
jgi:hypothetical protein